jgi:hypothetical protein
MKKIKIHLLHKVIIACIRTALLCLILIFSVRPGAQEKIMYATLALLILEVWHAWVLGEWKTSELIQDALRSALMKQYNGINNYYNRFKH